MRKKPFLSMNDYLNEAKEFISKRMKTITRKCKKKVQASNPINRKHNASFSAYLATTMTKNERFQFHFSIPNHKESTNTNMLSFLYTI